MASASLTNILGILLCVAMTVVFLLLVAAIVFLYTWPVWLGLIFHWPPWGIVLIELVWLGMCHISKLMKERV